MHDLLDQPGAALLEGWSDDGARHLALASPDATRTLPWSRAHEWRAFLRDLEQENDEGCWVGFLSYEALASEEAAAPRANTPPEPAAFFAHHTVIGRPGPRPTARRPRAAGTIHDSLHGSYTAAVNAIRESIRNGDVYQVNLTRSFTADVACDPHEVYAALTAPRPPRSSALLRGDGWSIASASPEVLLRFDRRTGVAESRPIKGTMRRGDDDRRDIAALLASTKDACEHLMIVDVVRNDFGKIAPPGNVAVSAYRTVRTLEHVHHLESTVRANGLGDASIADILGALAPAASITGAPKRAAVRMIRELEPAPRGVYCGAIGILEAAGRAEFSVAIRTAVVTETSVRYHAGGGIVWDSDPAAEDDECRAKSAAFLGFVGAAQ